MKTIQLKKHGSHETKQRKKQTFLKFTRIFEIARFWRTFFWGHTTFYADLCSRREIFLNFKGFLNIFDEKCVHILSFKNGIFKFYPSLK